MNDWQVPWNLNPGQWVEVTFAPISGRISHIDNDRNYMRVRSAPGTYHQVESECVVKVIRQPLPRNVGDRFWGRYDGGDKQWFFVMTNLGGPLLPSIIYVSADGNIYDTEASLDLIEVVPE